MVQVHLGRVCVCHEAQCLSLGQRYRSTFLLLSHRTKSVGTNVVCVCPQPTLIVLVIVYIFRTYSRLERAQVPKSVKIVQLMNADHLGFVESRMYKPHERGVLVWDFLSSARVVLVYLFGCVLGCRRSLSSPFFV